MAKIEEHLQFIYGEEAAQTLYPRVVDCWKQQGFEAKKTEATILPLSLTQRDALLITYGDQVSEAGVPPLRTLATFLATQLQGIVSGTHILPFYPFSSDDGFSVIDWFAVNPELGSWADVQKLGQKFDLMFDGVFNHLSAKSEWFIKSLRDDAAYRNFFIIVTGDPDLSRVVRPRALPLLTQFESASGSRKVWTTFSADQVDLNFKNPEVFLATLAALLFYVKNGARYIRLDAIAYLWKEIGTTCIHLPQTHRVVQLLRSILDVVAPEVLLITETNVPHSENISYFGDGTNEAQLVYNFALPPLVLHSVLTGDATELARWAASLRLPPGRTAFFNFLASHDGIGVNPARGILSETAIDALVSHVQAHGGYVSYKQNPDGSKSPYELNINYFDALSNPNDRTEAVETQVNRFMVAQAIMLALAGMPGIYFHSLFGSRNDREGAEASGIPRRINRQKLAVTELNSALSDPGTLRYKVFIRYKQLLEVRRGQPAFHPCGTQEIFDTDPGIFALLRTELTGKQCVLCLHNVSNRAARFEAVAPKLPANHRGEDLLSGQFYLTGKDGKLNIELSPYQVVWARFTDF
jgi:glycosidase